jgi:hypothetical protein
MKIKLTRHRSPSKIFSGGEERFYAIGLDVKSDYDDVVTVLKLGYNAKTIEDFDGIWFKKGEFEINGNKLYLYWHDDLGIFFVSCEQTDEKNQWLESFLIEFLPKVENYINQRYSKS